MAIVDNGVAEYSDVDLKRAVSDIDVVRHPEAAKALMQQLVLRLDRNVTREALASGAAYSQLDGSTRSEVFWPFLVVSLLFGLATSLVVYVVGGVLSVEVIVWERLSGRPLTNPYALIQVALTLLLAAPLTAVWLRVLTSRSFGGYVLRVMKKVDSAAA